MNNVKIVFMGTPDFACNVLQGLINNDFNVSLVVSQPDKYVGRKHILTNTPVKQLAINNNIGVFQPEKIKNDYQKIVDINPDLIITCAYGQIIPEELINLPRLGCINVHASLLPLPSIISKTNKRIKQNDSEATIAHNIKREDERINFDDYGVNIINKIRGLYSWPLANMEIDGIEYKILNAEFEDKKINSVSTIVEIDKNKFGISCKDGVIYITNIKPFGKKAMYIKSFLNGINK